MLRVHFDFHRPFFFFSFLVVVSGGWGLPSGRSIFDLGIHFSNVDAGRFHRFFSFFLCSWQAPLQPCGRIEISSPPPPQKKLEKKFSLPIFG